jgi:hypothetical protein
MNDNQLKLKQNLPKLKKLVKHELVDGNDVFSGQGATQEDILEAERQLEVNFPDDYKLFLREFGWVTFDQSNLDTIPGLGQDIPNGWEPGFNIVHLTEESRQAPKNIPHNLVHTYSDGMGNDIFMNEDGEIFFMNHELLHEHEDYDFSKESDFFYKIHDTFTDWLLDNIN